MNNTVTFTVLGNGVITNGIFSVRYVMDGDTPRFVLADIISDLGYVGVRGLTSHWAKKLGSGKLYNDRRGLVVNCVTQDQVAELFRRRYKNTASTRAISKSYEAFWDNFVTVRINAEKAAVEIQRLKEKIVSLETALNARGVA